MVIGKILVQRENFIDKTGDTFTPECLKSCAGVEVSVRDKHKNVVGSAFLGYKKGKGLVADFSVLPVSTKGVISKGEVDYEGKALVIGVGVILRTELHKDKKSGDEYRVIYGMNVKGLILTNRPVDDTLPRISVFIRKGETGK